MIRVSLSILSGGRGLGASGGRLHRERRTLLPRGTYLMPNDTAERWRALCARAAKERDSEKLLELAAEIDRLLEAQEQSLRHPEDLAAAA